MTAAGAGTPPPPPLARAGAPPRWLALALVLLGACWLAAGARAQDRELPFERDGAVTAVLRWSVHAGSATPHGAGFVRVEAENRDRVPRRVDVTLARMRGWPAGDVRAAVAFQLAPNQRAAGFLPLLRATQGLEIVFAVDGDERASPLDLGQPDGIAALLLADRPDATPAALARLQELAPGRTPLLSACRPAEAPADWRLLTGFDVVFVDGRARVPGDVQDALRRALLGGATLVVAMPSSLPPGELRQLATTQAGGAAAHGLGTMLPVSSLDQPLRGLARALPELESANGAPLSATVVENAQHVPGLGEPPVAVFLLVIVLFALLVGPVNVLLLRRWRRPMLTLLTVPLLGFGTTALILGYGLLHDGFGIRGVTSSWSWLDQQRHEVAAVALHTLFAGRAPASLAMGPDTLLVAPRATQRTAAGGDRWHYDAANGTVDGGALPSRTPTPLVTRQHGAARERLLAQRTADGALRLLTDAGVEPVGTVVLCDLDGQYWIGTAPELRRADPAEADLAVHELRRAGEHVEVEPPQRPEPHRRHMRRGTEPPPSERGPAQVGLARRLFGFPLPRGGWVAQVARAPWLDRHGLDVRHDLVRHFARGRMQAEDFVP